MRPGKVDSHSIENIEHVTNDGKGTSVRTLFEDVASVERRVEREVASEDMLRDSEKTRGACVRVCGVVDIYKMLHLFFFLVTGGSKAATIASSKTFLSCRARCGYSE